MSGPGMAKIGKVPKVPSLPSAAGSRPMSLQTKSQDTRPIGCVKRWWRMIRRGCWSTTGTHQVTFMLPRDLVSTSATHGLTEHMSQKATNTRWGTPPHHQPRPHPRASHIRAPELTATPPVPVPKLAAASTQAVLQPPAQKPTAAAGSAGSGCAISVNLPEHFSGSMNFSLGPGRATSDAASNPDRSVSSVPAQATVGVRSSGRDRSVSPVSVYDAIDPLGASLPHLRRVADGRFIPVEGLQGALRPTTGTISGLRRAHALARPSGIGDLSKFEAIQQGLMSKRTALNKKESSTRQHVQNVRKKKTKSQRSQVATAIKSAPPTRPRNAGMAQPVGPAGPVTHDHQDDVADPSRVDQLIQAKEQLEQYT